MYKLLDAGFSRLRKNMAFLGITIISVGIAIVCVLNQNSSFSKEIDRVFTSNLVIISVFIAIFVSLFVGREHSDGAIRNKIVVGHSRINIYISNLIISIVGAVFFELVHLLTVSIIGIPLLGELTIPLSTFTFIMLDILMIIVAYSVIFNFVSLIFSNITMSLVINIILVLAMFIVDTAIAPTANAKEFTSNVIIDEQGEMQEIHVPNPNYPGDTKKKICQTIRYIIPLGQEQEISGAMSEIVLLGKTETNIKILPLYSLGLIIVVNVIGIYLFSKKELK